MRKIGFQCLLILMIFSGCQRGEESGKERNTLNMSICRDPTTLDPRKGSDVVSCVTHGMLFEGLVTEASDGSIYLSIADRLDISEDKKVYTFHLREATWSDGTALTAEDFEYSWKSSLDPSYPCPNAHLFYPIANAEAAKRGEVGLDQVGIKALDPCTLQVTLKQPTPYFLKIIAFPTFYPIPKHAKSDPDWANEPGSRYLSNGPFLLKEWRRNDQLVLVKNPAYWDSKRVQLDGIHISVVQDEMTTLHMYERGETDIIALPLAPISTDPLKEYLGTGEMITISDAGTNVCFFNTEKFPFHNPNIRKAFGYALNRTEIVRNITGFNETAAVEAVPPMLKDKSTTFLQDNATEMARECLLKGLAELGLGKSEELGTVVFNYAGSEVNRRVAEAIQQQWAKTLGIQVQLQRAEYKVHLDYLAKRNYTVAQGVWLAQYGDPMNILERFKSAKNVKNHPGWENAEYCRVLDKSDYAETAEQRAELMANAERILLEEMPLAPIFHWNSSFLAKPYMKVSHCLPTLRVFYMDIAFDREKLKEKV